MALNDRFAEVQRNARARMVRLRSSMIAATQVTAGQIERDLKTHAPWVDRTGNARNGLRATPAVFKATPDEFEVGIITGHSVEYGIWLEVRWNGRFAIVGPTTRAWAPRYFQRMERLLAAAARGGA